MTRLEEFRSSAERAYRSVFNTFNIVATQRQCFPSVNSSECFVATSETTPVPSVKVSGSVWIDQLPMNHKADSPMNRLSVLLQATSDYRFRGNDVQGEAYLRHSMARLVYYRRKKKKLNAIVGLRYDFGMRGATDKHPLFHAQFETGVELASTPFVSGPDDVVALPTTHVLTGIRVPTPNVTGPTALLKVAADHLHFSDFRQVLDEVRKYRLFRECDYEFSSLDTDHSPPKLCASTWYSTLHQSPDHGP